MEPLTYPYKPKVIKTIVISIFLGALAAFMGYTAITNDQGLILNGVIRMGPMGASIFFWVLTLIMVFGLAAATLGLIKGRNSEKQIVLTDTTISAPKSALNDQVVTVSYDDILNLTTQNVNGQHFVNIHHPGGKLVIPHAMLPNKATFDELVEILVNRFEEKLAGQYSTSGF